MENKKLGSMAFLAPSALVGVAVAVVVGQYQPLLFDPDAYGKLEQASATEIKPVEVTAERSDAQPETGAEYSAADYGIDASNLKDGTYTGSGQGFKSTITVAVAIAGGKITNIEIVSAGDDEPYFTNAKGLIPSVIAAQSTSVDTISGATYSSKGILVAIKNALEKAVGGAGDSADEANQPTAGGASSENKHHTALSPVEKPASGYADGVYYGEGEGYKSTIRVAVSIANGKIASVKVVSQGDDAEYFGRAEGLIGSIVAKQTTAVDTVSGATFSSEGILAAVEDALRQAAAAAGNNAASDKGDSGKNDSSKGDSDKPNGGDSGSKPSTGGQTGGDKPGSADDQTVRYLDGEYTVFVKCENEEDEEAFTPYYLAMTVVVKDGKAAEIKDIHGTNKALAADPELDEYDDANDSYLNWAANGRTIRGVEHIGVVKQLLELRTPAADIDVVTRSTYSSRAIAKGYEQALALAHEAYERAQAGDSAAGDKGSAGGAGGLADADASMVSAGLASAGGKGDAESSADAAGSGSGSSDADAAGTGSDASKASTAHDSASFACAAGVSGGALSYVFGGSHA